MSDTSVELQRIEGEILSKAAELSLRDDNLNESESFEEKYSGKKVAIANAFLQARERTSLVESKLELLSIYKLSHEYQIIDKVDGYGNKYNVRAVVINKKEIEEILGTKSHKIYSTMAEAAIELKRKLIIVQDLDSQALGMRSLYDDVIYLVGKGRIYMEFNPQVEGLCLNLSKNYASLDMLIAFKHKSNGGFQLYKLLKVYEFKLPDIDESLSQEEQRPYKYTINYQELRMQLGYVDLTQRDLQTELMKKNPDYEKVRNKEKKPKFSRYSDFCQRVLDVGIAEINTVSDLYVTMEAGRGYKGRVEEVIFYIRRNLDYYKKYGYGKKKVKLQQKEPVPSLEDNAQAFYMKVMELMEDVPLKLSDIKSIAEAANYDFDIIKRNYEYSQNVNINQNFTGWIISAIKGDYAGNERIVVPKKQEKEIDTMQSPSYKDIDFDILEQKLLNKKNQH